MNKTLLAGGLAALTLAAAGVSFAQQAPARGMRADTDGDSRLSQTEFVSRRVDRLIAMDANRDGSVSAEERVAARQAHRAERADARFGRMDADNNGAVSRAEFDAARAAGREARGDRGDRGARSMGARGGHGGNQHGMARGEHRGPVVIAEAQARAEQAFTRLDSDHDGFVTADEARAGRESAREHRRERMTERRAARQASPSAAPSE